MGTDANLLRAPETVKAALAALDLFAWSELELRERVVSLETDCAVYRELALAAFDALRDLTVRHEHKCAECRELTDENRRRREDALLRGGIDI